MRSVMACAKFRAAGEVAVAEFQSSSRKRMRPRAGDDRAIHPPRNSLSLASDSEKACPGLDPGWEPIFGKDHAQENLERDDDSKKIIRFSRRAFR
jgi:hypothetical protein